MTLPPPAMAARMQDWLTAMAALDDASPATIVAYRADVSGFLGFMAGYLEEATPTALQRLTVTDMRAWMAHERGRGLSARSLARALTAVKTFYRWWSDREAFDVTTVLATRSPRYRRKLPRPLDETAARAVMDTVEFQSLESWIGARDTAVVTLLYGCGLRISEALSLTGADAPLPEMLRITGKGGKQRMVPVLPAARAAVEIYRRLCPFDLPPQGPLFRGARRGRDLSPALPVRPAAAGAVVSRRARRRSGRRASAEGNA